MFCICGKKCSMFCLLISIWGTLQLLVMGISYSFNSLSLLNSLPLEGHYKSLEEFRYDADMAFQELAIRCYVTAVLYGMFALVSYMCLRLRKSKEAKDKLKQQV